MNKFLIISISMLLFLPFLSFAEMYSGKYMISEDSITGVSINDNLSRDSARAGEVLGAESEEQNNFNFKQFVIDNQVYFLVVLFLILTFGLFYFLRTRTINFKK